MGRSAWGLRDRLREGYSVAEQEMVARWPVFGKLKGLARICPRPQALYERVIKLDGSASTRRVMEPKLIESS